MNRVLWTVLAFALSVALVLGLTSVANGLVGGGDIPSIVTSFVISGVVFLAARGAWRRVIGG
ncbi:hypothetical protein OH779_35485 [Actinacidiphila glaucinigra]|uniref:hypothetical protein n=1 Tax=Actinacidiphila glaucinigra TaxID=235986 RepID=UPI003866F6FB